MSNVSFSATGVTFSEAIDYREPKTAEITTEEMPAHFLYNSMVVKQATRLFAFVAENDVEITPARFDGANGLTISRTIPATVVSYSDMVKTLLEAEKTIVLRRAAEYIQKRRGGVTLSRFLINDGSFEAGQIVEMSADSLDCSVGIVLHAEIGSPVTVLVGKAGRSYICDTLRNTDTNTVVPASDYSSDFIAALEDARQKYVAEGAALAEDLGAKNGDRDKAAVVKMFEGARKEAKVELKALNEKLATEAETARIAGLSDADKAKMNPLAKKATVFTALQGDDARAMKGVSSKLANALNVDKFSGKGDKHTKWASAQLAKANGYKATNNLPGIQALVGEVDAYVTQMNKPAEPAKAAKAATKAPEVVKAAETPAPTTQPAPTPTATNKAAKGKKAGK